MSQTPRLGEDSAMTRVHHPQAPSGRGGPDPAPGRSQAGSAPSGGSGPRAAGERGGHILVCLRLPTRLLYEGEVEHVFAVAENGAFGLLPNHADHVASLVPSVLVLRKQTGEELFFGVDQGLLVKRGHVVDIAVRRGVQGDSLDTLAETVDTVFTHMEESEREARTALSRLEVGIVRQLSSLRKPV